MEKSTAKPVENENRVSLESLWTRVYRLNNLMEAAQVQKKCPEGLFELVSKAEDRVQTIEDRLMCGLTIGPKRRQRVEDNLSRLEFLLTPEFPNLKDFKP